MYRIIFRRLFGLPHLGEAGQKMAERLNDSGIKDIDIDEKTGTVSVSVQELLTSNKYRKVRSEVDNIQIVRSALNEARTS